MVVDYLDVVLGMLPLGSDQAFLRVHRKRRPGPWSRMFPASLCNLLFFMCFHRGASWMALAVSRWWLLGLPKL